MNIYRKGTKTTRDLDEFLKSMTGGALQVDLERTCRINKDTKKITVCNVTKTINLVFTGYTYTKIVKEFKDYFKAVQHLKTLGIVDLIKEKTDDK